MSTRVALGQPPREQRLRSGSRSNPRFASVRLAASVVIEQNDEWLAGRRYLLEHSPEPLVAGAEAPISNDSN
jgi:hypothetical protein